MSSARPLCVLCERPAPDGFVQAVNVDKEKLQNWLLKICGHEFAEEIEDHDLICYFCIWHAEFLAKHGLNCGADSWWPHDLEYLDDAAKELRKSYFDGKAEQCWVQLENVDDSEERIETGHRLQIEQKMRKCLYCEKSYKNGTRLGEHVKRAHKNAIRCENQRCATYFHTIEEKEEHVKHFHKTPRERKIIQCPFCEKEFQGYNNYRQHVRRIHNEYPVNCAFRGCIDYFKTEDEMKSHFDTTHKDEGEEPKAYECEYCGYRAKKKRDLERHLAAKHLPKTIKCSRSEMSSARPLCVLCERPAADGFIQADNVDKEKLQNWLLNICGYEFAEEIEDHDLICYFCIWHGEITFITFLEGKVEQCWVQLEEIAESEDEEEEIESDNHSKLKRTKCFYCDKSYKFSSSLANHVKNEHKNAIRCEKYKCVTYFHTIEEKEEHVKNFHEMPRERKIIQCCFCEKEFQANCSYHQHVRSVHTEFPVKCALIGCVLYFKSESDMKSHIESAHKEEDEAKVNKCKYCGFRAKQKINLEKHIARKHLPKTIKCSKCDKLFSTMKLLKMHDQRDHSFKICSVCDEEVTSRNISLHLKKQNCRRCKNKFDCLGLIQKHRESCKGIQFKCEKCAKTFQMSHRLNYHVRRMHRNNSWRGLQHQNLGYKCSTCKMFFKNATTLKKHLKYVHSAANLKQCAHCPKSFTLLSTLKYHLAKKHNLIACHFECDFCKKRFFQKFVLQLHIQRSHLDRARGKCEICGKEMFIHSMENHLLYFHDKH
ncbi:zinc finger protein 845-like [Cloeon dipterum]|uniref:zinc finger protein 845-like n=1 Tax=Cloeon dipterum TaxID=197152 RepID=UPI00321FB0D6